MYIDGLQEDSEQPIYHSDSSPGSIFGAASPSPDVHAQLPPLSLEPSPEFVTTAKELLQPETVMRESLGGGWDGDGVGQVIARAGADVEEKGKMPKEDDFHIPISILFAAHLPSEPPRGGMSQVEFVSARSCLFQPITP